MNLPKLFQNICRRTIHCLAAGPAVCAECDSGACLHKVQKPDAMVSGGLEAAQAVHAGVANLSWAVSGSN